MEDDILAGYRNVSSFALWDGEHAILSFTGEVNPDFVKTDSKGVDQHYVGLTVFLKEHSNENYQQQCNRETIFRVGKGSTLDKWVQDGGLKGDTPKLIFKVEMSKALGYSLRVEGRLDQEKNKKEVK